MKKKVVPKLRQEVKVKDDIVTCDDIEIYYTGKYQDFTARYIIKWFMSCPGKWNMQQLCDPHSKMESNCTLQIKWNKLSENE